MAKRKLDHLAKRVDGVAHAAKIVIGDVGAPLTVFVAGSIFGQQLDGCLLVDVDNAFGGRRNDHQPQFLKREGGGVE